MSYRILCTESNTPKWLGLRKGGIGASEAAAILGDTAWGTPITVWQQKRDPNIIDIGDNRMQWGHRLEAVILDAVAEEFPELGAIHPTEGLLQCVEHPWLLGTLDSTIDDPDHGTVPLEIKNVSAYQKKDWFNSDGMIAVPPKYATQVRQQAFVRDDAPGGWVGVLFDGNELETVWVPRSQEFIDNHLLGTLKDFWEVCVIGGKTPDPIYGDDLATLWPADDGTEPAVADEMFTEMVERWRDAKVREKTAREDIETLKFYFGVYLETATRAVDENGHTLFTMPERAGRVTVDAKKLAAEHPAIYEQCKRVGQPYRVYSGVPERDHK